ncbi:MAG: RagB/SusD family nutrient uptake outer membrane protein, partial [Bacteroidales bacterium]|nr:RagB/SusD family nutrient uptake outer membrane protein [Bacteroidales bacterium]
VDYDLYLQYSANDVRRSAYITTSPFNGTNYNHIKKYMQKTGSNTPDLVDLKVLRAAEVLLIRAEAYYRDGNQPAALADLNDLRTERYAGFVDGTE